MPDSPTTAMNVDRMMIGDDDFSRRSSLRSQSIYDYEGTHEGGTYVLMIWVLIASYFDYKAQFFK